MTGTTAQVDMTEIAVIKYVATRSGRSSQTLLTTTQS
jgi:hypothetical protein